MPEGFTIQTQLDQLDETVFVVAVEAGPVYRFVALSGGASRCTEEERSRFVGSTVQEVLPAAAAERAITWLAEALATGSTQHFEATRDHPDGTHTLRVTVFPLDDGTRIAGIIRDVTAERDAINRVQQLEQLHERWRAAFAGAPIGMGLVSADAGFVLANLKLCELLGRSEGEMAGLAADAVTFAGDPGLFDRVGGHASASAGMDGVEQRFRRGDGSELWGLLTWSTVGEAADQPHYFVQIQDIGPRRRAEARLAERTLDDALTGLPTRALFHRRAGHAIARIGNGSRGVAVLTADLDRFGRVNESLGHLAGDHVLMEVARRLRAAVPEPDIVARGGGDEFLVLLEDIPDADAAMAMAERLLAELRRPLLDDGLDFACPASIGVAFRAEPGVDVGTLEGDAALAMATAKSRGRGQAELYSEEMRTALPRLGLERELQRAVAEQQFVVHFQPEVSLDSNRIVGVEALVRWDHPERGLLPPTEFVSAAEESGVIVEIGRQVLVESCARLAAWSAHTDTPLTVAVNLSARQLADPDLVAFTTATLARYGLEPTRLVFDVTESTLVEDPERSAEVLHQLRELGVSVAIDDFGTGYTSLLYLKRFPADVLKIDRSFVGGLGTNAGDSAIVAAVVRLAHRLDLTVIAEGVETPKQLAHLRGLGCQHGQGYLWGRAVTAAEMAEVLRRPLPSVPVVDVEPLDPGDYDRRELDELLAVLTHELSTPLTVIGGYAEMLADRLDTADDARTGVAAIERNVANLGRLVAALADARGLGPGGETARFDAVTFVDQTMADLSPILTAHHVEVVLPDGEVPVDTDPVGLRQILTNLVGNATKFTDAGDRIEIVVSSDDKTMSVAVIDHGRGVPHEHADELFGRFARLGSTRRGLGLGLHLSRSIARRHGGDVVHQPTPGGGATFIVTQPLANGRTR